MKPKIHFESGVRRSDFRAIITTLCNRWLAAGVINSTGLRHEVTCRLCLKLLANVKREEA
jgi:hypothetical protein